MQHGKCSFQSLQTSRSAVMRNIFAKELTHHLQLLSVSRTPSPFVPPAKQTISLIALAQRTKPKNISTTLFYFETRIKARNRR